MAENEQDYSSSMSEDDVDSVPSLDEDEESVPDQIAPYEGEPLASSDDNGEGLDEEDEGDEDGVTASILERRFEKNRTSQFLVSTNSVILFTENLY